MSRICEACGQATRKPKTPPQKLRAPDLDRSNHAWLISRAAEKDTQGKPAWSYPKICRMLRYSRRIAMSPNAVRRLVQTHAPEVFAWRHAVRFGTAA